MESFTRFDDLSKEIWDIFYNENTFNVILTSSRLIFHF